MEMRDQRTSLNWTQKDSQALRRLIERIGRVLRVPAHAIDDVVQDCLTVVVRKFDGRELDSDTFGGEAFSSKRAAGAARFAYRCAQRIAPNHRRSAARRDARWQRLAESLDTESIGVCAPRQLEEIDEDELAACVQQQLTPQENQLREMLEERLAPEEISERLGKSLAGYHKARQRLCKKVLTLLYGEMPETDARRGAQPHPPPGCGPGG